MEERLKEVYPQPPAKEIELEIIDLSELFISMEPTEFSDHLRTFRKLAVNLMISVPWKGDYFLGMKLKAFIDGRTGDQKRTAIIRGTAEEREESLKLQHMPNVLNSGVKWEFTDEKPKDEIDLDQLKGDARLFVEGLMNWGLLTNQDEVMKFCDIMIAAKQKEDARSFVMMETVEKIGRQIDIYNFATSFGTVAGDELVDLF